MISATPLWDAMKAHLSRDYYSYHVPAHKSGRGFDPLFAQRLVEFDLTELPGLDNLFAPAEALAEAEALAAKLAGAAATHFTTNGSSGGIIAAMLAAATPGSTVLLPENAHISMYHACVLGDLRPVFLPVERHAELGIALGYTEATLRAALEQTKPHLVVAISPTYHGVCSAMAPLSELCRSRGVPLMVDEAHGTHFLVSGGDLPSAVQQGADLVVQSVHKTGGALTGAAWVHCLHPELAERVKRSLRLVQSTSPSYLLLASLDLARHNLAARGPAAYSMALGHAVELRQLLPTVEWPLPWRRDPLRVVVDARYFRQSGGELAQLMEEHGIMPEMIERHTVTMVVGLWESDEGLRRVKSLVGGLRRETQAGGQRVVSSPSLVRQHVLTPRQAHYSPRIAVALSSAAGRVCAESVVPYPPGIPLLWPGQLIEASDVQKIVETLGTGGSCAGVSEDSQIQVIVGGDSA